VPNNILRSFDQILGKLPDRDLVDGGGRLVLFAIVPDVMNLFSSILHFRPYCDKSIWTVETKKTS